MMIARQIGYLLQQILHKQIQAIYINENVLISHLTQTTSQEKFPKLTVIFHIDSICRILYSFIHLIPFFNYKYYIISILLPMDLEKSSTKHHRVSWIYPSQGSGSCHRWTQSSTAIIGLILCRLIFTGINQISSGLIF